ncbi:MAG: hypothetical protein P8104_01450 [Gammaproteobacteria bacterium]
MDNSHFEITQRAAWYHTMMQIGVIRLPDLLMPLASLDGAGLAWSSC